jgi:hypothetical protein
MTTRKIYTNFRSGNYAINFFMLFVHRGIDGRAVAGRFSESLNQIENSEI